MNVKILNSLDEIDQQVWNELIRDNNPFLRHEFLYGLETTGCATSTSGWQAHHIAIFDDDNANLLAAMPCYLKDHSYGEYIFDWAWANAFHQNGVEYYPKLSNAVPFTPATGERILLSNSLTKDQHDTVLTTVHQTIDALLVATKATGFHSLFLEHAQRAYFSESDYFSRENTQFHWHNKQYTCFDDFLAELNSKKRKNIKRERRRVEEMQVTYQWHSGADLSDDVMHKMHQFYQQTIAWYGAQSYLNKDFFQYIGENFKDQTLVLFAYFNEQIIAGGLFFKSDTTLYGRYWGALNNFHSVHFETCYYQAIEYCIKHKLARFEAGAQGHHKVARGLLPSTVYSAHKIQHPQFHRLLAKYTKGESQLNAQQQADINQHSPFKQEI
jgi:predicted N-acyltransferase